MKNSRPREPTREEKKIMSNNGLIANNWLVVDDPELESYLKVVSKRSGHQRIIDRYRKAVSTPTKAKRQPKNK